MSKKAITVLAGLISLSLPSAVKASLAVNYQETGNINWSLDGFGSNLFTGGTLTAVIPTDATIEKAFLYSATHRDPNDPGMDNDPNIVGKFNSVTLGNTVYNASDFNALGKNPAVDTGFNNNLQAYRVEVTSQITNTVTNTRLTDPLASIFNFTVSESNRFDIDGEILVVIYKSPSLPIRTIALFDGFSASTGDNFLVTFPTRLPDVTAPGFEALFSLGISFGTQPADPDQFSTVDVNGRRLTSSAGGQDDGDGIIVNNTLSGTLITVGGGYTPTGISEDSPDNPNPNASPVSARTDDELYDLAKGNGVDPAPFLATGSTLLRIATKNPSQNDNIFFAGINITASGTASVDNTPLSPVPEPATALFGIALSASCGLFRLRRKSS